jgi:predicted nucleic acid-binding protein
LTISSEPVRLTAVLSRSLDLGEASVIQTAADLGISTVCIDESAGRQVARLHGLLVTGSLGVLLKAVKRGHDIDLDGCISRMRDQGIWVSETTRQSALAVEKGVRGTS